MTHIERIYANYEASNKQLIEPCERFALANQQLERHMTQVDFELFDFGRLVVALNNNNKNNNNRCSSSSGDQERFVVELDEIGK